MRLPATIGPQPGQALDSYLEHVADANDLSTAELLHLARTRARSTRFLTLVPDQATIDALADLTGQDPAELRAMTLTGLAGHEPWHLTDFDADVPNAFATIGNRGWLRTRGSQLCPACLTETGAWLLRWRLQTATCCARHGTYLATRCPFCRRPFRDQPSTPLRPVGAALTCGNPLGSGLSARCAHALTTISTQVAAPVEIDRQQRHDSAIAGVPQTLLGEAVTPGDYLAETRNLATFLLHLAGKPGATELVPWAVEIQQLARAGRTPWATSPPSAARHRSLALTEADRILTAPSRDEAADRLTPWILLIPRGVDGPIGWAGDRTRLTPAVAGVLFSGLNARRRLSHLLDAHQPLTGSLSHVPQQVPDDLYKRHLAGLTSVTAPTGRLFASLCLARSHPGIGTWMQAAAALGLDPDLGRRTAIAASARLHAHPTDWSTQLTSLAADLEDIDYRKREQEVGTLANSHNWFRTWKATRPGTRASSRPYAVTWLWLHHARGLLDTSPARAEPSTFNTGYRQFTARLTDQHKAALLTIVNAVRGPDAAPEEPPAGRPPGRRPRATS